ncbi:MAG TPA: class I SAM-dependent methyltransferase [Mycobacteriales bacterium]|nr:class I SAM-dependent methyltransferase [Mycobacteriales bacterium]
MYDTIGVGYAHLRVPDPRIAAQIQAALGPVRSVVNVGAGSGSYEPGTTRAAVEPSSVMIAQRPTGAAPAVQAVAEALPFADGSFDAALAVLTTHHWSDPRGGLAELARVSRRQVVLTWDQEVTARSWLVEDYLPQITENERDLASLRYLLHTWPDAAVVPVPVHWDCSDGFLAAYWRRPEAYLRPAVRRSISAFAALEVPVVEEAVRRLASDLDDGTWHRRHHDLLGLDVLDCGYRLVVRG